MPLIIGDYTLFWNKSQRHFSVFVPSTFTHIINDTNTHLNDIVLILVLMSISIINKSTWVFSFMKNIKELVDFSLKKLDNQLLLGEIKNRIKVKNKDFKVFLIC